MLFLALSLAVLLQDAPEQTDPLPRPDPAITRSALEHHLRFLASDELRGRKTATPESERVSGYLARALERAGVEPGGSEGYFQPFPLLVTHFSGAPQLRVDGEPAGEYGPAFSMRVKGDPRSTGPLAVRVVRTLEDLPEEADRGVALVMASSRFRSFKYLEERGQDGGRGWGLIVRVMPEREAGRALGIPADGLVTPERAGEDLPEQVTVYGALARRLWEGEVGSIELVTHGERRQVLERNVVGLVRGAGTEEHPELAEEVVVVSAHFDHLGVRQEGGGPDEDRIYNGADDDASGTAVLLELAEGMAAGPPPARTVLFLFCSAEEIGMLGTFYWADHPTLPLEHVICNLNLEMLGMPDPIMDGPGQAWLTGYERSDLGPALAEHGVVLGADRRPEQRFFLRSDNIVFVQKGIVGQTISTGGANPNYHQVSDEVDTLDFDHMQACAEAAYAALRLLADGTITPHWNPGEPNLRR